MEEILKEFARRAIYHNKAAELLKELGMDGAEVDTNKFSGNKEYAMVSLKPINITQHKRLVSKLRKLKFIKEEPHTDEDSRKTMVYFLLLIPWETDDES